jgi:hypothetical protein
VHPSARIYDAGLPSRRVLAQLLQHPPRCLRIAPPSCTPAAASTSTRAA